MREVFDAWPLWKPWRSLHIYGYGSGVNERLTARTRAPSPWGRVDVCKSTAYTDQKITNFESTPSITTTSWVGMFSLNTERTKGVRRMRLETEITHLITG